MKNILTQSNTQKKVLPLLVVPLFEDQKVPREYSEISRATDGALQKMIDTGDFKPSECSSHLIYPHNSDSGYERVLLLGLGAKAKVSLDVMRRVIGSAIIVAQSKKIDTLGYVLPDSVIKKFKPAELGEFCGRGISVASYAFDTYKNVDNGKVTKIKEVHWVDLPAAKQTVFENGLVSGMAIGESANFMRELGNLPPMIMTPTYLAKAAQSLAKTYPKMSCTVFDKAKMKQLKMGAILGVAAGSVEPPKFIILEFAGAAKSKKPIVLVGKGITFDSGGISIKPASKMDEMKYDMLGGGTVMGVMRAIAELGIKKNVIGIIPATENLSGGAAYRPGDILTAANGKTIEVLNTDAEGRLILADALSYASGLSPRYCIDLATLTGACLVALGIERAAVFSDDKKLLKTLEEKAEYTGDKLWQLPMGEEFTKLIKSQVADVKNIGGRNGGSSTAASFLKEFTDYPWAHLDIAGTGWNMKPKPWIRAGATGHGVHLLVETVRAL